MDYGRKREERWRELAKSQLASGLSAGEFSKRKKICLSSFYGWRKRLGFGANQGTRQVPGSPESRQSGIAKGFLRVTAAAPSRMSMASQAVIRIETPNGYRIEAAEGTKAILKDVLELLQRV
jgi:hypothetical protein